MAIIINCVCVDLFIGGATKLSPFTSYLGRFGKTSTSNNVAPSMNMSLETLSFDKLVIISN